MTQNHRLFNVCAGPIPWKGRAVKWLSRSLSPGYPNQSEQRTAEQQCRRGFGDDVQRHRVSPSWRSHYAYALLEGKYSGALGVGAGYMSDGEVAGERLAALHGYYVQLEQLIYRECACHKDNSQGLEVFAAYYPRFLGSAILTETIGDSFAAGLVYTGLIPNRNHDHLGAGVTWAELFQGGTNQETVCELFYKAWITPHLSLQPDLQYIATPSGILRDALVVGVRFQVVL